MQNIEYFEAYTGVGLQVIPLYPCSKVPVGKGWNVSWDYERSRTVFERFPNSNMGILLGRIVDVEGDTVEANDFLMGLLNGYPHPAYTSSRSTHHLFLNPDPRLTIAKYNGVEFRANKHQSVLPPSKHEDGTLYAWVKGSKFPIPEMPEPLLEFYKRHSGFMRKPFMKPGHVRPWCTVCRQKKLIHEKRYKLEKEAFASLGYGWQCHTCREFDVRELCRKLRKKQPIKKKNQGGGVYPLVKSDSPPEITSFFANPEVSIHPTGNVVC